MKLVIDIDEEHLNLIKYKVEQGNTDFTPYVIIANGKPLPKGCWIVHEHNGVKNIECSE